MHDDLNRDFEHGISRQMTAAGACFKEFQQAPSRQLPWHRHDEASISFVLAGSYRERFRGLQSECTRGTVVLKPPVEPHADSFGTAGGRCLLIELSPARLETIGDISTIASRPSVIHDSRLAAIGREIYREFRGVDSLSRLAAEALMLEVLVIASRAVARERGAGQPAWLTRVHELINDTFREPITLSSIAAAVGVHPAHLARTFRKHYQASIGEYIRRLRIEHASHELATGDASLVEIGLRSGFFDQSHFSRVFKQYKGQTPAAFRTALHE